MQGPENVKQEFLILHEGWEMDNKGWITTDGEVYSTNHGALCSMSMEEIDYHIKKVERSLAGLRAARETLEGGEDE